MEPIANQNSATNFAKRGTLIALAIAFLTFDLLAASISWLSNNEGPPWAPLFVIGLVTVQINLIAFWTAVGPGRMVVRIPWMVLAITLAYVCLHTGAELFSGERMRQEEKSLIAGVMLFAWLAVTLTLVVYRAITRRRLIRTDQSSASSVKFHLRHLIVGTALCGATLAVLKWAGYPVFGVFDLDRNFYIGVGIAAVVNLLITIPVILAAFRWSALWWRRIVTLVSITVVVTTCEVFIFTMLEGMDDLWLVLAIYQMMNLTQCFGLLLSLLVIRYAGYELQVADGARDAATDESPVAVVADPWTEEG
ncbi:hypothetical protein LOC68_22695 [Blastopirellula sp. JC732]|uniref:Uncharacterized protein n=1 Tax=Blastopirellula sediminis TaxID=2894196 RepID=A0A9X1SIV5_9BACT|nr:hypothetical protein [Blastopirellula sediminis]MCC9605489.1 hypothetical protein [Blastopirellula sediminis]MCC9631211.1 hypothetical protein [Blastopirellula sediminis]